MQLNVFKKESNEIMQLQTANEKYYRIEKLFLLLYGGFYKFNTKNIMKNL
jgi:hypothetical protein